MKVFIGGTGPHIDADMRKYRKLSDSYVEKPFIEGYLHSGIERGDLPEYGYQGNHLPATSGKIRKIESSLAIALRG